MKVVLVNPPKTCDDLSELAPPLGLLRLAALVERQQHTATIVDFNLLWHTDPRFRRGGLLNRAEQVLLNLDGDVYGFTSMAIDSHVAIELARRLKRSNPSALMVLGGTHFSSIASHIRDHYPFIDHVVTGEGEGAFAALLGRLARAVGPHNQLCVLSNSPEPPAKQPLLSPAYHLVNTDLYFHLNPRRLVNVESGRGCRFRCKFCYSPSHYSSVSYRDVDAVIQELDTAAQLGARELFFVDDNILNDPTHAIRLCEGIASAKLDLRWSCYATFPQLEEKVIRAMALAGCDGIFTGIDAIGETSARSFSKSHMPRASVFDAKLRVLADHNIRPTCAFLISPPSHACGSDISATVEAAIRAKARGAEIRINTLTLYNETEARLASTSSWAYDDFKVGVLLDMPSELEANPLARVSPEMYPFHARYVPELEHRQFISLAHCLFTLVYCLSDLFIETPRPGEFCVRLAKRVLHHIGPLERIPKSDRRVVEYDAAKRLLLSSGSLERGILEEVAVL